MGVRTPLPAGWEVPKVFRERLGDGAGKQRLMQADGQLLLVLHRPPQADEPARVGRYFWRKPDGAWQGMEAGGRSLSLASHLAEMSDAVERLDRAEEAATTARDYFELMNALGPLERTARNLHKVLQGAREAAPGDRELINHRDRAYELERSAELLHVDAKNGLEFAVARQSEEQSAAAHRMAISAHRLNLLAAFFFPLATLAAVLGMNVKHGWEELPPPFSFLTTVAVGLSAGALLALFVSFHGPRAQRI
jgi:hypothetical protein